MPTALLACLLAATLAGVVAVATPALLAWCPAPLEADDLPPFRDLASPAFRWSVFGTAAVAGVIAFLLVPPAHWGAWAPLASVGALLAMVDVRTAFLPTRLNYLALSVAGAGVAVAAWLEGSWAPLVSAAASGAVAAGVFWVVWRVREESLGFGDVRLAGLIGVVTGCDGFVLPVWAFLLGTLAGALWGAVAWMSRGRDGEFPYGPALLLGPFLALLLRRVLQLG